MNVSLELNLGDFIKFYKITPRNNGKVITDIVLMGAYEGTKNERSDDLCSILFENTESFNQFISLCFEEVEDRIIEYVIVLQDYNKNTHYSKYYSEYYNSKDAIKEINKLCNLCLNIKEYNKINLKDVCYSQMPIDEDLQNLPANLRSLFS